MCEKSAEIQGLWSSIFEGQERVKCSPCKDVALAYMFHDWMIEEDGRSFGFGKAVFLNPSMEQLWLAFTMRENFQKIWNGEEWENA
jgi:hypothetical protein